MIPLNVYCIVWLDYIPPSHHNTNPTKQNSTNRHAKQKPRGKKKNQTNHFTDPVTQKLDPILPVLYMLPYALFKNLTSATHRHLLLSPKSNQSIAIRWEMNKAKTRLPLAVPPALNENLRRPHFRLWGRIWETAARIFFFQPPFCFFRKVYAGSIGWLVSWCGMVEGPGERRKEGRKERKKEGRKEGRDGCRWWGGEGNLS